MGEPSFYAVVLRNMHLAVIGASMGAILHPLHIL